MRGLSGGGHSSGGGRSFGGSGSGGSRSFGGFRAGGGSSTRRVGSGNSGGSSGSGDYSSGGDIGVGAAMDFIVIIFQLFGPFGALLAGGIFLTIYLYMKSVIAGSVCLVFFIACVFACLFYKKRSERSPIDTTFVDEFADDRRYDKDVLYSEEFETYLLDRLRGYKILDKKNRIEEGQMYRVREAFDWIYKDYMNERRLPDR